MLSVQVQYTTHNEQIIHDLRLYSYNTGTELTGWSRHTHHLPHTHTAHRSSIICSAGVYTDSWGSLRCHAL